MKLSEITIFIFFMMITFGISFAILSTVIGSVYYKCSLTEEKWFREEGVGGFIGRTKIIETKKEFADYSREVCVEGINWYDFIFRGKR